MEPETMKVQVRKDLKGAPGTSSYLPGVLIGNRFMTPQDGPFDLDHKTARRLLQEGIIEAVVQMPIEQAERTVDRKLGASRR